MNEFSAGGRKLNELPGAVFSICPECSSRTAHEVLKGRMGAKRGAVLECTLKCNDCGFVHKDKLDVPKERDVPLIVSDENNSYKTSIPLAENDHIEVGDEILLEEYPIIITSIESNGKRVNDCTVSDILTLWAKRFDKVKVGIAINRGPTTTSIYFWAAPDEEFSVGDVVTVSGNNIAIIRIKTAWGTARGAVKARNVSRLYGRPMK